ncbi:Membralin [Lepeophtheirus salmonis]|uniref:Membralin n=1 Tax=Lepeophtheirus salmonis TaxID=72036 RepID=A0A7R8CRY6_LEPSM|nr:Membralin [Lepeophtheirus salmonis]CAF2907352.1 Membralin [Lepeophtheirus salmonis]
MADVDVGLNVNNNNNNNGNTANNNVNNNNVNEDMGLITVQDRLLQTIFLRITLAYARACPKSLRRLFETLILLKAILCFFILIYIHFSFGRNPVSCLEEYKDSWPREGILRVEIMRGPPESYSLAQSYDKERKLQLKHRQKTMNSPLSFGFWSIISMGLSRGKALRLALKMTMKLIKKALLRLQSIKRKYYSCIMNKNSEEVLSQSESETEYPSLEEEIAELEHANNDFVWPEDEYIFEYIVLDPQKNTCFGDSFSQLILQNFLGYDDVLISSIKSLAEHEDNKGFLRNVVSSAHYHFVSRWTSSSSYLLAFLVMMAFTMSISTLSRYSQHQIFVFIMELLQRLEFNTAVTFQAAPLLTEILAFVGMEAIMSEFFENSSTAFYIILIVWVADQYDAICCRTAITKNIGCVFSICTICLSMPTIID